MFSANKIKKAFKCLLLNKKSLINVEIRPSGICQYKKILNEINILRKIGKSRRDPEIFTFYNTAKKLSKKEFFLVCILSYYSINLLVQSE